VIRAYLKFALRRKCYPNRSRAWRAAHSTEYKILCVYYARSVEKDSFSSGRSLRSEVPAWRDDVVRGYISRPTRVFIKETPHPAVINRSIDCPPYPRLFPLNLMVTRFARVRGRGEAVEGIGRGKNMVRNRDTGLRLIETSQSIYIVQCSKHRRALQVIQDQSKYADRSRHLTPRTMRLRKDNR